MIRALILGFQEGRSDFGRTYGDRRDFWYDCGRAIRRGGRYR